MNISPRAQKIIDWRESFTKMPDTRFFDIIRMYLGEVKTPYNKQDLLEELSSFLRKEENQRTFAKLLCSIDLKILAAVRYIPGITQEKIKSYSNLFGSMFSSLSLTEHIANLEQRLLIFEYTNHSDGTTQLRINPFLEDFLLPLIPIELLLPKPASPAGRKDESILLAPQFLAAFITYIIANPDLCKADGSIKKKNAQELDGIFAAEEFSAETFALLIKAFCNISLFRQEEKILVIDWERLSAFSELPEPYEYAYLCAASCGHFSRSTLHANAQLLYDTLNAVPYEGYERQSIINLALLIKERTVTETNGITGRFAEIMARAGSSTESEENDTAQSVITGMIDSCTALTMLRAGGKDESGKEVLYVPSALSTYPLPRAGEKKLLSVNAGSTVTVMPGLTLSEFIPLIKFLSVCHYDTAVEFEISRHTVMRSFDSGMTPALIEETLLKYSSYSIPQNIHVSLEDWNSSYSSAALYYGYVLKVSKENILKTRNDRILSPFITAELAEGIFLLNFSSEEELRAVMSKSSLDFVGKIHSTLKAPQVLPFIRLKKSRLSFMDENDSISDAPYRLSSTIEQTKFIEELKERVLNMDIPLDQKEGLLDRVEKRIIVNPEQLRGSSVRFECLEASGMDYQGKIRIIEEAIQTRSLLEMRTENDGILTGMPVALIKQENDADVEMTFEDGRSRHVTVGKVSYLKKIRKTLTFI